MVAPCTSGIAVCTVNNYQLPTLITLETKACCRARASDLMTLFYSIGVFSDIMPSRTWNKLREQKGFRLN